MVELEQIKPLSRLLYMHSFHRSPYTGQAILHDMRLDRSICKEPSYQTQIRIGFSFLVVILSTSITNPSSPSSANDKPSRCVSITRAKKSPHHFHQSKQLESPTRSERRKHNSHGERIKFFPILVL